MDISVLSVDDVPIANPQTVTTLQSVPVPIMLISSDEDGDTLIYSVSTTLSHGFLNGTAPDLIYTPGPEYKCVDTFSFIVNDGELDSALAEITKTINQNSIFVPVIFR